MILDAKLASETKVGKEVQKIKQKMEAMAEKIKMINDRVTAVEPNKNGVLKTELQSSIAKLEEVWEGEVSTLKHELWQTIQAHNHNADLLKHHKDAIDQVQARMTESAPTPELDQVHAQLLQVDKVLQREMAKEAQMDQLMTRLTLVHQQLFDTWGSGAPVPPPGMGGIGAKLLATTGKKTQKKSAKVSQNGPKASAASLRAEAPEFVPSWDS
eukprot:symbB.v1.2.009224.t1/scaffold582.1/size184522/10